MLRWELYKDNLKAKTSSTNRQQNQLRYDLAMLSWSCCVFTVVPSAKRLICQISNLKNNCIELQKIYTVLKHFTTYRYLKSMKFADCAKKFYLDFQIASASKSRSWSNTESPFLQMSTFKRKPEPYSSVIKLKVWDFQWLSVGPSLSSFILSNVRKSYKPHKIQDCRKKNRLPESMSMNVHNARKAADMNHK